MSWKRALYRASFQTGREDHSNPLLARLTIGLKKLQMRKQLMNFEGIVGEHQTGHSDFGEGELEGLLRLARHQAPAPWNPDGGKGKVFGIGLSRTGTNSLTQALHLLGIDTVHYPTDSTTFRELTNGQYRLSLLRDFDGITDITASPYYAQLDETYPGSRFILTVRDKKRWLESCQRHWHGRSAFASAETAAQEARLRMRQFLRASVYGCYGFEESRFSYVYDQHVRNIRQHFKIEKGRSSSSTSAAAIAGMSCALSSTAHAPCSPSHMKEKERAQFHPSPTTTPRGGT